MDEDNRGIGRRLGLAAIAGIGTVFGVGILTGIIAAHVDRGGGFGLKFVGLASGAALFTALCAFGTWRAMAALNRVAGAPTKRERRNRIVLAVCAALGGVIAVVLSLAGPSPTSMFSNEPLPPMLALALAVPIAVLVPILSVYWHRMAADEQEAAAYNKGALIGIYTYFIGAPTWWLLWRGGFVPAPDGIIIYFVTVYVTGAVWLWAKYR